MPKTPDEIKKGLECCAASYADCHKECPYKLDCDGSQVLKDALALIQQLEADNAQLNRCIENMTDKLNALNDEVAKLQAERDALRDGLKVELGCYGCKHYVDDPDYDSNECMDCGKNRCNFEWRGVQKEGET